MSNTRTRGMSETIEGEGTLGTVRLLDENQQATLLCLVKRLHEQATRHTIDSSQEQRRFARVPFFRVVTVTPCPSTENPLMEESEAVVAKDISSGGLCYVHNRQPREKQILVTLNGDELIPVCMLAQVRYVAPTGQGLYSVGVAFIQRVHLAIEESLNE